MGVRPDERRPAGGASWIAPLSERSRTMITERNRNARARGTPTTARRGAESHRSKHEDGTAAPIVAAVDDTPAATAAAETAVGWRVISARRSYSSTSVVDPRQRLVSPTTNAALTPRCAWAAARSARPWRSRNAPTCALRAKS